MYKILVYVGPSRNRPYRHPDHSNRAVFDDDQPVSDFIDDRRGERLSSILDAASQKPAPLAMFGVGGFFLYGRL